VEVDVYDLDMTMLLCWYILRWSWAGTDMMDLATQPSTPCCPLLPLCLLNITNTAQQIKCFDQYADPQFIRHATEKNSVKLLKCLLGDLRLQPQVGASHSVCRSQLHDCHVRRKGRDRLSLELSTLCADL